MASPTLDEARIKSLFKQALLEVLEERRDILYDVFADVVEDLALAIAIKEGEVTETAPREDVFQILDAAP